MGGSTQPLTERLRPWFFFALGLCLALPSLGLGLWSDDWGQGAFLRRVISGEPTTRSWWDLYVLVPGGSAQRFSGVLPWWSAEELRISFFRPLSAATHVVDYALWPDLPWVMHLHSGLWFGASCAAAFGVLRRLTSKEVAVGAALLYAVSHVHASPMGWVAQRNAVISATFGLMSLSCALDFLREGRKWSLAVSGALFVVALLASEGAVIIAVAVVLAGTLKEGSRRRWALLATAFSVLVVGWRAVYAALGYGVRGSGTYLDPFVSPGEFLSVLPLRASELLGLYMAPVPVAESGAAIVGGVVFVALGAWCAWRWRDPVVRYGAAVLLATTLILTVAEPAARLLSLTTVFFSLLVATVFGSLGARGGVALALFVVGSTFAQQWMLPRHEMRVVSTDSELGELSMVLEDLENKTLVLIDPPDYAAVHRLQRALLDRGVAWPQWTLVLVTGEAVVEQQGCCVLEVSVAGEALDDAGARFFSADPTSAAPFSGLWFRVARPAKNDFVFEFASSLEAPHFVFAKWGGESWGRWYPAAPSQASLDRN